MNGVRRKCCKLQADSEFMNQWLAAHLADDRSFGVQRCFGAAAAQVETPSGKGNRLNLRSVDGVWGPKSVRTNQITF